MLLDGLMEHILQLLDLLKMPQFVSIGIRTLAIGIQVSRSATVENISSIICQIQNYVLYAIAQFEKRLILLKISF